ncbi:MAG: hypothetical protein SO089_03690 [Dialister sp.]|nr:hypothetical protein [Dialister sp.]MDY3744427.1 hypothetical protein [Dialister sp.]MDY4957675.1 hypothetical protein [Dialister sp.]MDY5062374.1 hypothetical protein [Dialister sp.]MDY5293418.1 hypothetical protein [Dialister sp.]
MHDEKLNYILNEFIAPGYMEVESSEYLLTEEQDSGHTELTLHIKGENICISQYDKKSRCGFWNRDQQNGLSKCVDHAVLQHRDDGWVLHMIEMKGRMDNRKWFDVRLKNRASYLDMKSLCAALGIQIKAVYAYTTYGENRFSATQNRTNPRLMVAPLGKRCIDPVKEWTEGRMHVTIGLNEELVISHRAILMERQEDGLKGELIITGVSA